MNARRIISILAICVALTCFGVRAEALAPQSKVASKQDWETFDDIRKISPGPVWREDVTIENVPYLLRLYDQALRAFRKEHPGESTYFVIDGLFQHFFARSIINAGRRRFSTLNFSLLEDVMFGGEKVSTISSLTEYLNELTEQTKRGSIQSAKTLDEFWEFLHLASIARMEVELYAYRHEPQYTFDASNTFRIMMMNLWRFSIYADLAGRQERFQQLIRECVHLAVLTQDIGLVWRYFDLGDVVDVSNTLERFAIQFPYYAQIVRGQLKSLAEMNHPTAITLLRYSSLATSARVAPPQLRVPGRLTFFDIEPFLNRPFAETQATMIDSTDVSYSL